MKTVYITIGNSDDKLTQQMWAEFIASVSRELHARCSRIHGKWFSEAGSHYQNAIFCGEIEAASIPDFTRALSRTAFMFKQESIAMAILDDVKFIGPTSDIDVKLADYRPSRDGDWMHCGQLLHASDLFTNLRAMPCEHSNRLDGAHVCDEPPDHDKETFHRCLCGVKWSETQP